MKKDTLFGDNIVNNRKAWTTFNLKMNKIIREKSIEKQTSQLLFLIDTIDKKMGIE
jgi:hypothetical protein